ELGRPPYPKGFGDAWGFELPGGLDPAILARLDRYWRPPTGLEPRLDRTPDLLDDRCLKASVVLGPQASTISNAAGRDAGGFAVEVTWDGILNTGTSMPAG